MTVSAFAVARRLRALREDYVPAAASFILHLPP